MATQNCPRCKSDRIRLGYRSTSIFQKLMFRYNLLCNDCNWEFVGFAIPGTVSTKVKRRNKETSNSIKNNLKIETKEKDDLVTQLGEHEINLTNSFQTELTEQRSEENEVINQHNSTKNRVKKRVRVKLT